MRRDVLLLAAGMALVTAFTRLAGVWAGRGPLRAHVRGGRAAPWLAHLPGAVLVSLVAPVVARGGPPDAAAAALAMAVAARTRSLVAGMAAGVLAAAVLRRATGS